MDDTKGLSSDSAQLTHSSCLDVVITSDTTIAQILTILKYVVFSLSTPCNLSIVQSSNNKTSNHLEPNHRVLDFLQQSYLIPARSYLSNDSVNCFELIFYP